MVIVVKLPHHRLILDKLYALVGNTEPLETVLEFLQAQLDFEAIE